VAGSDATADAAAVALATHPPAPEADPVEAAAVVPSDDPLAGIAASVLTAPPLRMPVLYGDSDGLPETTEEALDRLAPRGGGGPADAEVYRVGDVGLPQGLGARDVEGDSPAALANEIDRLRQQLTGADPAHLLLASGDEPAFAMPAAAWAARSGDPVLFTEGDSIPKETAQALERHQGVPVYALGPESAISAEALREAERSSPGIQRIVDGEDPVTNAIGFARYVDTGFGWNINDPGHGLVVANANRPGDAAAAAGLSASGKWGPLVLVEDPNVLPDPLRQFLLDIKPGYQDDPTRALYNHLWLIGDESAISAAVQAEIDELAELVQVGGGGGGGAQPAPPLPGAAPVPGGGGGLGTGPEQEPPPDAGQKGGGGTGGGAGQGGQGSGGQGANP
jgi:hypothetical protein